MQTIGRQNEELSFIDGIPLVVFFHIKCPRRYENKVECLFHDATQMNIAGAVK